MPRIDTGTSAVASQQYDDKKSEREISAAEGIASRSVDAPDLPQARAGSPHATLGTGVRRPVSPATLLFADAARKKGLGWADVEALVAKGRTDHGRKELANSGFVRQPPEDPARYYTKAELKRALGDDAAEDVAEASTDEEGLEPQGGSPAKTKVAPGRKTWPKSGTQLELDEDSDVEMKDTSYDGGKPWPESETQLELHGGSDEEMEDSSYDGGKPWPESETQLELYGGSDEAMDLPYRNAPPSQQAPSSTLQSRASEWRLNRIRELFPNEKVIAADYRFIQTQADKLQMKTEQLIMDENKFEPVKKLIQKRIEGRAEAAKDAKPTKPPKPPKPKNDRPWESQVITFDSRKPTL